MRGFGFQLPLVEARLVVACRRRRMLLVAVAGVTAAVCGLKLAKDEEDVGWGGLKRATNRAQKLDYKYSWRRHTITDFATNLDASILAKYNW